MSGLDREKDGVQERRKPQDRILAEETGWRLALWFALTAHKATKVRKYVHSTHGGVDSPQAGGTSLLHSGLQVLVTEHQWNLGIG